MILIDNLKAPHLVAPPSPPELTRWVRSCGCSSGTASSFARSFFSTDARVGVCDVRVLGIKRCGSFSCGSGVVEFDILWGLWLWLRLLSWLYLS
jgi:hypothetical protein